MSDDAEMARKFIAQACAMMPPDGSVPRMAEVRIDPAKMRAITFGPTKADLAIAELRADVVALQARVDALARPWWRRWKFTRTAK